METLSVQLSTSLSGTCYSSPDCCRHAVFDYSNRLIGLHEALTQIPLANTKQLPNFLLGMGKQRGHQLLYRQREQDQSGSAEEHCINTELVWKHCLTFSLRHEGCASV